MGDIWRKPWVVEWTQYLLDSYVRLCADSGGQLDVAVRSSATAEDLPDASFAGQQQTPPAFQHRASARIAQERKDCLGFFQNILLLTPEQSLENIERYQQRID